MTTAEFLDELQKTDGWARFEVGWCCGALRNAEMACPLVAVARARGLKVERLAFGDAAVQLGIPRETARKIALAADGGEGALRQQLLRACGLEAA